MNIQEKLTNYFRAGYPCIALETSEESRALADVVAAATAAGRGLAVWSATQGLRLLLTAEKNREVGEWYSRVLDPPQALSDTNDPMPALRAKLPPRTVVAFLDLGAFPFSQEPVLSRVFFDCLQQLPPRGGTAVLLGATFKTWPAVEKAVTVVPYDLPSEDDLVRIAQGTLENAEKPAVPVAELGAVARAAGGLSVVEAENAFALSLIERKALVPEVIYREKVAAVRRTGLLDLVEPDPRGLNAIGGLDELKGWVLKRRRAFGAEAEKYGLPPPRGVLLAGIPGTGKSLAAKAIGTTLGLPTLRLDVGALFGSLVGESEARTRQALALAEALAPCVLWMDEIEKSFSGSSGQTGDSGTSQRVFGTVLTWLQERKRPVFLVATANDIGALPPEFSRRGRWDELFALGLPGPRDREAILRVIMKKYTRYPWGELDMAALAQQMNEFTGAEIESAFVEAMYIAFDENREVAALDVAAAANRLVPLAKTAKEQIDAIRKWAAANARPASTPEEENVFGAKGPLSSRCIS